MSATVADDDADNDDDGGDDDDDNGGVIEKVGGGGAVVAAVVPEVIAAVKPAAEQAALAAQHTGMCRIWLLVPVGYSDLWGCVDVMCVGSGGKLANMPRLRQKHPH